MSGLQQKRSLVASLYHCLKERLHQNAHCWPCQEKLPIGFRAVFGVPSAEWRGSLWKGRGSPNCCRSRIRAFAHVLGLQVPFERVFEVGLEVHTC